MRLSKFQAWIQDSVVQEQDQDQDSTGKTETKDLQCQDRDRDFRRLDGDQVDRDQGPSRPRL